MGWGERAERHPRHKVAATAFRANLPPELMVASKVLPRTGHTELVVNVKPHQTDAAFEKFAALVSSHKPAEGIEVRGPQKRQTAQGTTWVAKFEQKKQGV